jgi:hypothetical protein
MTEATSHANKRNNSAANSSKIQPSRSAALNHKMKTSGDSSLASQPASLSPKVARAHAQHPAAAKEKGGSLRGSSSSSSQASTATLSTSSTSTILGIQGSSASDKLLHKLLDRVEALEAQVNDNNSEILELREVTLM